MTREMPDKELPASVRGVTLAADGATEVRRQKLARIILDATYQFLGLLDVDGTVLEINQAALDGAGIHLADVAGKPFWEARWWAVSEETRNRVRGMVEQARSGEFVRCDIEIFGDQEGSKTIFVDFSLTPIRDDSGRVAFLLPEGRNISEKIAIEAELTRKNSELQLALERLREIDGFKTKFFANVSHELRTPLALILGPVDQLLREEQGLGERERFRLTTIKRNAQSLLRQVNDLLDLARIDAQQMPLAYVCANVVAQLCDVAAGFTAAAEERAIALVIDGVDELYADVDRAKFARVLTNLLSNAFKFTPAGGRICCPIERVANGRFLLSVQDNGLGVAPQMKQQIFDRFAQGQGGLAGSGLGLNIVKEFVELHGGTVVVLDAPGGGAIFQVEMPLRAPNGVFVRDGAESAAPLALPDIDLREALSHLAGADKAGNPRVLVVEDNPELRHFLHDVLIDDYNVTLAADGAEGLVCALAATQAELARVARFTAMGELVASTAHEVNQPLSAIVTNSQAALRWLARETPDYREVVAALNRVNRDASLAGEVIARIRGFLSRGGVKRKRLVARQVVDDLLLMLQGTLQEAKVAVDLRIDPELTDLQADPVQLQQVLLNLMVSAVDAMRGNARRERVLGIAVSVDADEGVVFAVSDTGPGIAPDVAERIFDALFSTKPEGLGMGLAISRSIVENHGSRLRLAPAAGGGASFVFNIPVNQ